MTDRVSGGDALVSECPACGSTSTDARSCSRCHVDLRVAPTEPRRRAGWLITRKRWGKVHVRVIVRDSGQRWTAMGVDGEVTEFNEAGWLPLVDLADDKVRSAAGAVFLSSTRDLHTIDGLRDVDPGRLPRSRALRKWALDAVSGSVGSKRSLAIDLLAHRLDEHLDSLALTTTEIAAARGDWAASVGDWPVAASAYALLPAGTYRSRIHPVICALNRCWLDPSTRWTLVRWLEAAGDAPEAKLSAHYFKGSLGTARAAKDALEPFSGPRAETAKSACDALAEGRVPCDLGFAAPEVLLLQAIEGKRCPVDWGALRPDLVDEAFVDDLIDSGVITGADRAGLATRLGIDGVYLRARLEPEALTDRDVAALGWDRERERRAGARGAKSGWVAEGAALAVRYLAGDDSAIDQLSTRWPESDVSALRGARAAVHDAAPLLPTGGEPPSGKFIPAAVLAHLWDRLPDSSNWDSQQRGLSSAVGLRRARAALWDADWGSARDWSRGVLRIARDENARDEALNVIACALWQSGDDTGALATGVASMRFVLDKGNFGDNDQTYYSELMVFGAPTVPEPATLSLLGVGVLLTLRRRHAA